MPDNKTPDASVDTAVSLVRVYNRSTQRSFTHGKYVAAPASFCDVTEEVAKLWFRLFPDEVVEAGVAQKELSTAQAALNDANTQIEVLKKQLAEATAKAEAVAKAGGTVPPVVPSKSPKNASDQI